MSAGDAELPRSSSVQHNQTSLTADLRALGVEPGDVLFIHSSFRSLRPVAGGAETVVRALEEAVGARGTILMPSFNLGRDRPRTESWDIDTSPSTVGWLSEYFRQRPGTVRSDHYSHSVAARGHDQDWFVRDHRSLEGIRSKWDAPPWGKCYGTHSPMWRVYLRHGKVLMLGVDYTSSTYMHLIESLLWNEQAEASGEPGRDIDTTRANIDRPVLGAYWDEVGPVQRGSVGDADCRLFPVRAFIHTLCDAVRREPQRFYKS